MGYSLLLLAQLMIAITIVVSKYLLIFIPVINILIVRFFIAFIFLLLMHIVVDKFEFKSIYYLSVTNWVVIIFQAVCAGFLFNIFLLLGLKYTSAGNAGIITSILPAIIIIFSVVFLKEKITISIIFCVLFSVLGLVIINAHSFYIGSSTQLYGCMLVFISLIPDAIYYISSKRHPNKLPIYLISSLINGINFLLFFILYVIYGNYGGFSNIAKELLFLIITGISTGFFYVFWLSACQRVKASIAGLSTAFMPIFTLIIADIFLGERITLFQILGMVLVVIAILSNVFKSGKII